MAQTPVIGKFITKENITQVFDIVREYNKSRKKGDPILHHRFQTLVSFHKPLQACSTQQRRDRAQNHAPCLLT